MDAETQRSIDQSKHLLKQISEDSSVPRNIRRAANEAMIVLEKDGYRIICCNTCYNGEDDDE